MNNWLNIFPIGMVMIASVVVLISENWRAVLISLAAIYLGSFVLLLQVWPFTMAAAKLVTGWMCVAILSFVTHYQNTENETGFYAKRIFKVMGLLAIWVVALILSSTTSNLFQVTPEIAFGAFAILGCGLLQLGMSSTPFKVILGILSVFAGFEILYAGMESSILVNGLILAVDLMIAFVGSYLVSLSRAEDTE